MAVEQLRVIPSVLYCVCTAMQWQRLALAAQLEAEKTGQVRQVCDIPELVCALLYDYTPSVESEHPYMMQRPQQLTLTTMLLLEFGRYRSRLQPPSSKELDTAAKWLQLQRGYLPQLRSADYRLNWPALWWITLCTTSVYGKLYNPPSRQFIQALRRDVGFNVPEEVTRPAGIQARRRLQ